MSPARPRVVVVGGGIGGLTAAYELRDVADVTVVEAADTVGGKLRVSTVAGLPVDEGAEAMLARRPEGVELTRAVGLGADLTHPATAAASIWSRGALRPLPPSLLGMPTDLAALARSRLLTARELARVPADTWLPRTPLDGHTTVGRYVRLRLGRAVVDRLVEPVLGGVYAGSADALAFDAVLAPLARPAREHRSLLAAAREATTDAPSAGQPVFAGLRGGLGRLAAGVAVASAASVRTGTTARALEPAAGGGWRVVVGPASAPEALDADAVILAAPARPTARLLRDIAPHVADDLASIDYASVALVTLVYLRAAFRALPPGSGYLVPPVDGRLVKGVTLSTQKWGWYAEHSSDLVVVRLSVGRAGEEHTLQRDDADLAVAAAADLADVTGVSSAPLAVRVTRWGGALPQYGPGHVARIARVRAGVAALPGLAVCGAAYDGVGIPAVIASARAAGAQIRAVLNARQEWTHGRGAAATEGK